MRFVAGASDYWLKSFDVPLIPFEESSGLYAALCSDVEVEPGVYAPSDGDPLEMVAFPVTNVEPAIINVPFSGETVIQAGTAYWVALVCVMEGDPLPPVGWFFASGPQMGTVAVLTEADWETEPMPLAAYRVIGQTIPEPGTLVLFGSLLAGAAGGGLVRRRNRRGGG